MGWWWISNRSVWLLELLTELTKKYINTLEQNVNQYLDENKYKEVKAAVVDAHDVKEEVDDELPSPCPSPCPQVLVLVLVRVRREHQMKTSLR